MILASTVVNAAEPVFTTENIGVLTALILALSGFVATILSARSKAKVDEIGKLQSALADAEKALEKAKQEHKETVDYLEAKIATLRGQIDERDDAINKLDRVLLACRTYIARLLRVFADRDETPPPRPPELDEA